MQQSVAVHKVMAVASLVVLLACGAMAPRDAAAQSRGAVPKECKELGDASPKCTEAKDQQMKAGLGPRACEKYGADSPQCEKAKKKRMPKTKNKSAAAASAPAGK